MTVTFSPEDLVETKNIVEKLLAEVTSWESTLSGGTKFGLAASTLQSLRETKISFGNPIDNLILLTPELFEEVGVQLSEVRRRQMAQDFNFYYMTVAVSLQPKRGTEFRLVECALTFGPQGEGEPIVEAIFPKSEWRKVLGWGGKMDLALDGNLEWRAGISGPSIEDIENLLGRAKLQVANKNELAARIVIADYLFSLGRAEIAATGEGNSQCFWRIEQPTLQEMQTVQFGVVFKVPKDRTTIELTGLVAAEPSMSWLVANLSDVIEGLSDNLRDLLGRLDSRRTGRERLPIGDFEKWTIILPN